MAIPTYPTPEQLRNASKDANTLDKFGNDAAGVPNINRVGNDVENMMTLRQRMLDAASDVANRQVYLTRAEMLADTTQPVNTPARVETGEGAGDYVMTATGWEWSDVQPASSAAVVQAQKTAEDAAAVANAVGALVGSDLGNSVLIGDEAGNVGMKLSRDELLSGAVGFRRTADGHIQLKNRESEAVYEVASMPSESPYLVALVDPAGSIGAAITRDGTVVSAGSTPTPPIEVDIGPVSNSSYLRNTRMAFNRLLDGANRKLNIAVIGDSNSDAATRYISQLTRRIMRTIGDGGGGWIGSGFNGVPSHGNARQGSTAGTTEEGTDNLGAPYGISRLSATGLWACEFDTAGGPDLSCCVATEAGAPVTVAYYPDKAVEMVGGDPVNMTRLQMHYDATAPCTIEYAWNGSETFTQLVLAESGGPSVIDIGTPPAGKAWVNVRLVSGTWRLFGFFAYSDAAGAVVSKLGANGTAARTWEQVHSATFTSAFSNLPADLIIIRLGTNDQGLARSAEQYRSSMVNLYDRIRAAKPVADILIVMPEENVDPGRAPYPMSGYAAAMREWCIGNKVPYLDLQPYFGATLDYGPDGAFPMLADTVHLSGGTGGGVVSGAIYNALFF